MLDELFNRPSQNTDLKKKYHQYCEQNPNSRRRDVANSLSVSEAILIDEQLGLQSVRLNTDFKAIIEGLPQLGYIMTLMRNDAAVHERKGIYQNVKINGAMGLIIADDRRIDLRLFLSQWKHGYAVKEMLGSEARYSLQFFNEAGVAIQKIFLQSSSDIQAYKALVESHLSIDQLSPVSFVNTNKLLTFADSAEVNQAQLVEDWSNLTDVHQFMGFLRRHNVSRQQAFALVGEEYAQQFTKDKIESVLRQAAQDEISIMCFVGNKGGIQIHTGIIKNIKRVGGWLNILDEEFNLHLLEENVADAWLVRKPTSDGIVTSLELYDVDGDQIAQFFGQRQEGKMENPQWKLLAETVLGS